MPAERERTDTSADSPTSALPPATHSRRRLLQTLVTSGSLLLAGCGQGDSGTSPGTADGQATGTPGANGLRHVSGQTFRAPIEDDPSKTTFLARHDLRPASLYGWDYPSYSLQRFLWETGVWPDSIWVGTGDIHYTWIEKPIEITPTEITISLRDDARWSDGQRITGRDIAIIPVSLSLRRLFPPYYAQEDTNEPRDIYSAFDGFELPNQSVTYRSSAGHFDIFWDHHIKKRLGTFYGPHYVPTHLEPYDAYANAVIETARRAQQGEITPWKQGSDAPSKRDLVQEYIRDIQYAEKFGKAENVVTTGAWDLVKMGGAQEFVFEKNEHHRNADRINFETLVLEYTPSDTAATRQHAALKADRLDYGSAVTPQSVAESFPDHITQLQVPGDIYTGNELEITLNHPGMGDRAVRAAIMYALNHEAIAKNIHQSTALPVENPGRDCWDSTEWASQDWLDTNLITYETNREKATTLMLEAGFTRDGNQWISPDGKPLELTIATKTDTPRWEPTVASQLSEFGIPTSVRSLSETEFSTRTDAGDFSLWIDDTASMTNTAPNMLGIWYHALRKPGKYGIYPKEQFVTGDFSVGGEPVPKTEERWSDFTIEAPPVGEPDGPLREYTPAVLPLAIWTNPPEAEFRRRVKTGMWLANWFLPILPITKKLEQHFIDEAHWLWPTDTPSWKHFTGEGFRTRGGLFASGTVHANPDNPEK